MYCCSFWICRAEAHREFGDEAARQPAVYAQIRARSRFQRAQVNPLVAKRVDVHRAPRLDERHDAPQILWPVEADGRVDPAEGPKTPAS
jgi:hypothetical protein